MNNEIFQRLILNGDCNPDEFYETLKNNKDLDFIVCFTIKRSEILNIEYISNTIKSFIEKTEDLPIYTDITPIPANFLKKKKNIDNIFVKKSNKGIDIISINSLNIEEFFIEHLIWETEYYKKVFIESVEDVLHNSKIGIYQLKGEIFNECEPYALCFNGMVYKKIK
jgi:hypothetical protein